jgi:hypothetical protein
MQPALADGTHIGRTHADAAGQVTRLGCLTPRAPAADQFAIAA